MPGRLYTPLPKNHGERVFVERILELTDEQTHVWAGVDYLPGTKDMDVVLVQDELAAFNIEVKAVSLDMIEAFGLNVCTIRDRVTSYHPVAQAHLAQLDLRNFFTRVSDARCPFFYATAAFSKIRRSDMKARFSGKAIEIQLEQMLFLEDLENTETLLNRLQHIRADPPRGGGAKNPCPSSKQFMALVEVLDPGAPTVTLSDADRQRGETVARQVGRPGGQPAATGPAAKYLKPVGGARVVFRGAAGTGKTVQLQEVAVAHARAGKAVLFTCYNRVLASSMRGILSTQALGEDVDERLFVTHIDELRFQVSDEEIDRFRGLFGTVCVDEAQDMDPANFDFLEQLAAPDADWFLADGSGQDLYHHKPGFLEESRERGVVENLRRVFRNSAASFLVAQGVVELAPDLDAIDDWVAKHPLKSASDDQQLALDVPSAKDGGTLPRVVWIDRSGPNWRQERLRSYTSIIFNELELLAGEGKRRDLAILCAQVSASAEDPAVAREALGLLGVPFLDQIDAAQRSKTLPRDHVRLVSIHSSRGIEASRVIVLGMTNGISVSEKEDHRHNSRVMSYIALSRAQIATTIVAHNALANPFVTFIDQLSTAYQEADSGPS